MIDDARYILSMHCVSGDDVHVEIHQRDDIARWLQRMDHEGASWHVYRQLVGDNTDITPEIEAALAALPPRQGPADDAAMMLSLARMTQALEDELTELRAACALLSASWRAKDARAHTFRIGGKVYEREQCAADLDGVMSAPPKPRAVDKPQPRYPADWQGT